MTTTATAQATQVYQVYSLIMAAAVVITGFLAGFLSPSSDFLSSDFEFDPPRRLVHGWRSLYDAELAEEPASRVTWEIDPQEGGVCFLTVTHDQLDSSPKTAANIKGWTYIISSLKTLLETGEPLAA